MRRVKELNIAGADNNFLFIYFIYLFIYFFFFHFPGKLKLDIKQTIHENYQILFFLKNKNKK